MTIHHAVLWIDHHEAHIARFVDDEVETLELRAHGKTHPIHRDKSRKLTDPHFFAEAAKVLHEAERVLVVGPGTAKMEFLRYLHGHDRALEAKVVSVETVDHPTDNQLVAYARKYFKHSDRITG